MDDNIIKNQRYLNIVFKVKSRGVELLIYSYEQYYEIIRYINIGLSLLSLIVFMFGTWLGKMISVEILNIFQLIFLLHFMTENYTESIMVFRQLTYSMLNFKFCLNSLNNIYLFSYEKLIFDEINFFISVLIVAATLFVS